MNFQHRSLSVEILAIFQLVIVLSMAYDIAINIFIKRDETMKILSLLFLTTTALLAMDGDEKELRIKPKTHFSDSIEDAITEFVNSGGMREMEIRACRVAARQKEALQTHLNERTMLADIGKRSDDLLPPVEDSLSGLMARLRGFTIGKVKKRPHTEFVHGFGGRK